MRKILLVPILLLVLCFSAFADGGVVTLDEAIQSAMENNTDMEIAKLELQQNLRSASNASAYIPNLTLTGSASIGGNLIDSTAWDPDWSANAGFDVGISMSLGTSLIGSTAVNNASRTIANLNYAISASTLEQSVTTSYWTLVSSKKSMESAQRNLDAAERALESVQEGYDAGLRTSLELSNAELDVLDYRYALKQLQDAYALSQETFRVLTGIEGDFDVTDFPEITYLNLPSAEELFAQYGDSTNTVRMLNATVTSSEAALTNVKVNNYYPSVSLSLNYGLGGDAYHRYYTQTLEGPEPYPNSISDTASATVSFSIPISSYIPGSTGNNAVKNAEDSVAISKMQLIAGRDNLLSSIRSSLLTITQDRENIEIATTRRDIAQQSYNLTKESYDAGLVSFTSLQDSADALSSAELAVINAEGSYIQNLYTLAFTLNIDYESLITLYAEK